MTNAVESHAAGEAGQRLALRRPAEDGLTVVLAGRWCLDETLPSQEAIERELSAALRRLTFDTAALGDWDSGLLTFLSGVLKACAARGIAVDQDGLPEGLRRLLAMAAAVPEQKVPPRAAAAQSLPARVGAATLDLIRGAPAMLRFLGEIILSFLRLFAGRARFRANRGPRAGE